MGKEREEPLDGAGRADVRSNAGTNRSAAALAGLQRQVLLTLLVLAAPEYLWWRALGFFG